MKTYKIIKTILTYFYALILLVYCNDDEEPYVNISNVPKTLNYQYLDGEFIFSPPTFLINGNHYGYYHIHPEESQNYILRIEISLINRNVILLPNGMIMKMIVARKVLFSTPTHKRNLEGNLISEFTDDLEEWDGTFDYYNPSCLENLYELRNAYDIKIKIGYARYEINQPMEYFENSYSKTYMCKIKEEGTPIGPSKISVHKYIKIEDEVKYSISWDEIYNANTKKIKIYYNYFKNPNESRCKKILFEVSQVGTTNKYNNIIVESPISNVPIDDQYTEWNGKLYDENNELVYPDGSITYPKLKFKIGFIDKNDNWSGQTDDYIINIDGQPWVEPEISFSDYYDTDPILFEFDADEGDFLVNIFINSPRDLNSKIWFEFGPIVLGPNGEPNRKYKSNVITTKHYITEGQYYKLPIIWGGYTNDLLNDCISTTTLKAILKYSLNYPTDEKQKEIELPLNVQGGNSYPLPVTVEVDQYSGLDASEAIEENIINNAFAPAGRYFSFTYDETIYVATFDELGYPKAGEDWEGEIPDNEVEAVITEYKNKGKQMYIYYTKKIYEIDKEGNKKNAAGLYCEPPINGIVVMPTSDTRITFIHELGHNITEGVLKDETNNHYYYKEDNMDKKIWDPGCVMPYKVKSVGDNTSFNRIVNPHFCRTCMEVIRNNICY